MASDNTARELENGNIMTMKGRMVWPSLLEPSKMRGQDDSQAKYQITLLVPAGANIDALKAAAKEAAEKKFGSNVPKGLRSPFRKTEEKDNLAELAEDFPFFIIARSKDRPGVVGPNGKATDDPEGIYSGRWARMTVQAFGYDQSGNRGVSFGLQNVQLLDHDDALSVGGGRVPAESEFAAVEGAGEEGASSDALFD